MWANDYIELHLYEQHSKSWTYIDPWRHVRYYHVPSAEPILLRHWLAVIGEILIVIGLWLKDEQSTESDSQMPMPKLDEIRSCLQPPDKAPTFSLN